MMTSFTNTGHKFKLDREQLRQKSEEVAENPGTLIVI